MVLAHKNNPRGRFRAERGTALVELAIVMPLLLVLILGMIDFGKAMHEWIDTTQLASAGARMAAVDYCPDASVANCGWTDATKSPNGQVCPVSPYSREGCIAWYVAGQADIRELHPPGRTATATSPAPAQNAAQVCVIYPNGATTKVGDPVRVEVKLVYHWLKYLTNQVSLGSTQILGKATMRLEGLPASTSTACYPTTGGAGT